MPPLRQKKLIKIFLFILCISMGVGLILYGFQENLHLYVTPSALHHQPLKEGQVVRLGGFVKSGSLVRRGLEIFFVTTDFKEEQGVRYQGILPDLFKENSGMIAEGYLNEEGTFIATSILAKHDENYRPPGL